MGKPSVRDRKIVNTVDADGNVIGVNAQQYVVLVQDVPDLIQERERYAVADLQFVTMLQTLLSRQCSSCCGPTATH
jgi:hypothetical protein